MVLQSMEAWVRLDVLVLLDAIDERCLSQMLTGSLPAPGVSLLQCKCAGGALAQMLSGTLRVPGGSLLLCNFTGGRGA